MEKLAPPERAESWDNVGLLVGSSTAPVRRIMVTLDVTAEGIRDAERKQTDLIISHHPVLFRPISAIKCGRFLASAAFALGDCSLFGSHQF